MIEPFKNSEFAFMRYFQTSSMIDCEHTSTLLIQSPNREIARTIHQHWIAHCLSIPIDDLCLAHDAYGRPCVSQPTDAGLYLSRSYRTLLNGEVISALSIAHQAIGVDIEMISKCDDPKHTGVLFDIPWNILRDCEREILNDMPPQERHVSFIELWALKEAYLKACGVGLMRAPETVQTRFQSGHWLIKRDELCQKHKGQEHKADVLFPTVSRELCHHYLHAWLCVVMLDT